MQKIDTVLMSLQAIRSNKLRSSLTLVGIVLGVASIIAVMTGISVIQVTMEKEMSVLGTQTFPAAGIEPRLPAAQQLVERRLQGHGLGAEERHRLALALGLVGSLHQRQERPLEIAWFPGLASTLVTTPPSTMAPPFPLGVM